LAKKFPDELQALTDQVRQVLATGRTDAALIAMTFFHLRFEFIHPLRDGNGRIGRLILGAQIQDTCRIPIAETLGALKEYETDYRIAFGSRDRAMGFELLHDLLARLTAMMTDGDVKTPFSLDPVYPDLLALRSPGRPKPK